MSKYWKLLVLRSNQYIECETEEEVIHLIESLCKDMEQDRIYKHHTIETQYPNYNFEHVTVFDSSNIRQFLYFFDTIEEECDGLREQISRRNSKIVKLIDENSNLRKELKSALESLHDLYDCDDGYPF